jgi:hypothetical protein
MDEEPFTTRAFNLGCDARLAGESLARNPFPEDMPNCWKWWVHGWLDVDKHWGKWANNTVEKLKAVGGLEAL